MDGTEHTQNMENGIRIRGGITLETVLEAELRLSVNAHGFLSVKGIAAGQIDMDQRWYGEKISMETVENGEATLVFQGVLTELELCRNGSYSEVRIEAMTGTCLLDMEKKSRSFQNTEQTCGDLVKKIVSEMSGGGAVATAGRIGIGKPLIQYRETDWEFIKRLAGLAGAALIPDTDSGLPRLWFMTMERSQSASEVRRAAEPARTTPEEAGCRVVSHICRKKRNSIGKTVEILLQGKAGPRLGDRLYTDGQEWMVYQVQARLTAGELVYTYWLTNPKEVVQARLDRPYIAGLSLTGKTEKTAGENIYVRLDIDGEEAQGDYGYDYRPVTGQILYGMPEMCSTVSLLYPEDDERDGIVVENPGWAQDCPTARDSGMKRLETDDGKELFLFPVTMGASAQNQSGQVSKIVLADRDSVWMDSFHNLSISAVGPVTCRASSIRVHAPLSIEISQGK